MDTAPRFFSRILRNDGSDPQTWSVSPLHDAFAVHDRLNNRFFWSGPTEHGCIKFDESTQGKVVGFAITHNYLFVVTTKHMLETVDPSLARRNHLGFHLFQLPVFDREPPHFVRWYYMPWDLPVQQVFWSPFTLSHRSWGIVSFGHRKNLRVIFDHPKFMVLESCQDLSTIKAEERFLEFKDKKAILSPWKNWLGKTAPYKNIFACKDELAVQYEDAIAIYRYDRRGPEDTWEYLQTNWHPIQNVILKDLLPYHRIVLQNLEAERLEIYDLQTNTTGRFFRCFSYQGTTHLGHPIFLDRHGNAEKVILSRCPPCEKGSCERVPWHIYQSLAVPGREPLIFFQEEAQGGPLGIPMDIAPVEVLWTSDRAAPNGSVRYARALTRWRSVGGKL